MACVAPATAAGEAQEGTAPLEGALPSRRHFRRRRKERHAGVVIGLDPHKRSVTIVIMNHREKAIDRGRFGTDRDGYQAMPAPTGRSRRWSGRPWHRSIGVATAPGMTRSTTAASTSASRLTTPETFSPGSQRFESHRDVRGDSQRVALASWPYAARPAGSATPSKSPRVPTSPSARACPSDPPPLSEGLSRGGGLEREVIPPIVRTP